MPRLKKTGSRKLGSGSTLNQFIGPFNRREVEGSEKKISNGENVIFRNKEPNELSLLPARQKKQSVSLSWNLLSPKRSRS
ncbi:MAG: hypothetical protein A2157_10675 [Deltaproteobacteria bacterium RBG_16_47_11]|nr:MAG: hypothetical protein A2157_10675 [Deltaproteobacteria bacterium RBG_16_47_11]